MLISVLVPRLLLLFSPATLAFSLHVAIDMLHSSPSAETSLCSVVPHLAAYDESEFLVAAGVDHVFVITHFQCSVR